MFAHGETVTRLRAPLVEDRYNDEVPDWPNAVSVDLPGWGIARTGTSEAFETGRDATVSDYDLFKDGSSDDIDSRDRLIIRGTLCEIVGEPFSWVNPFTGLHAGQVVKAKIKDG